MNIRKKLTFLLLLASAIPLIIFTCISLNNSIQLAEQNAMAENLKRAEVVHEKVDSFINKNLFGVKVMATNPSIRAYGSRDPKEIKTLVTDAVKVYPELALMIVTGASGTQVARSDDGPLTNVSDRNFFKLGMQGQPEVISEVLVSKDNGHLIAVLAAPIRDFFNNNVTGVIQGTVELAVLNDFVKTLSNDEVTAFILDQDGKLLAHPTKNMQKPEERTDFSSYSFAKNGLSGQSGSEEVTINDQKLLISYVKNEKSGWLICTEVPYHVINASSINGAIQTSFIGLLLIALTGAAAFYLSTIATKPILALVAAANQVAKGDLTIKRLEATSKDELGLLADAFNTMVLNLTQLIRQIQGNAELVAASSEQLNASSEQSAQAANQVASSITEVAQSAEQQRLVVDSASGIVTRMSENVSSIAANAGAVSEQSALTAVTAQEGGIAIQNAVNQMTELEATVNSTAKEVTELGERSKEIGQIVNTISGIAGQTNLLALNAAIEAARAGEQGRGFAVVAEEVRKLAEQSQVAAKQIEALIRDIQNETDKAVQTMNSGNSKVKTCTIVVNEAGTAFQKIIDMIAELSQQVKEITVAIQHTEGGSQQIVAAVENIAALTNTMTDEAQTVSAATEEQSAAMQEIASSSQNLSNMAAELQEAIGKFRI
ncbi:Methyl-accepting chemotaxis protein McpB [Sporomusa sphaeroides DSM 2875]|uniref:Methyl-accepting chemotaxis protein McpB n=1 Tax=Sporomusa sphaeroides DSM 2875 TaxID=1337886 RepID=A0ABM9W8X8_9FIRM|nr:methyl-accepting chemotaxis protein McpB [Sporomusa sphaeroides DSM 2875]CVK20749.1 Methyl-accepting chemotaxis protein McpB [Sporomusa sphaeroides DSM 2875]